MKKHLNIKIYGLVQGVFFRPTAKEKAEQLNIQGFAKNQPEGFVYIEVEGEEKDLDEFVKWSHEGSPQAKVEKVVVTEGQLKNFTDFSW